MHRQFSLLAALVLLFASFFAAQAQTPPPDELYWAVEDLNARLGTNVQVGGDLWWSFVIESHDNYSLGCSLSANAAPLGKTVNVYVFSLQTLGTTYEYRVVQGDRTIPPVSCDTRLIGYTSSVPGGICPADFAGYLGPRVAIGMSATVVGVALDMTDAPGGSVIASIPANTQITIIDGPYCQHPGVYWLADVPGIGMGWVQESQPPAVYYFDPITTQCLLKRTADTFASVRQTPDKDVPRVSYLCPHESIVATARNQDASWYLTPRGWIAASVVTPAGSCGALPISADQVPPPAAAGQCPAGTPLVNLEVNGRGTLIDSGYGNDIMSQPYGTGAGSTFLVQIPPRGEYTVVGGPMCDQTGMVWWQVNYNGTVGWTAQGPDICGYYWLLPVGKPLQVTLSDGTTSESAPPSVPAVPAAPAGAGQSLPATAAPITRDTAASLQVVSSLTGSGASVDGGLWAPDGGLFYLAGWTGSAPLIEAYTVPDLAAVQRPPGLPDGNFLAFSPDGRYLAMRAYEGDCYFPAVYDFQSQAVTPLMTCDELLSAQTSITDMHFHSQGSWLGISSGGVMAPAENAIYYWTPGDADLFRSPNAEPVFGFANGSAGELIAIRQPNSLLVWNAVKSEVQPLTIPISGEGVPGGMPLAFKPGMPVLAFADGAQIRVAQIDSGADQTAIASEFAIAAPAGLVTGMYPGEIVFSSDGSFLAVTYIGGPGVMSPPEARLYSASDGQQIGSPLQGVVGLSFSPDGKYLAAVTDTGDGTRRMDFYAVP